MSDERRYDAVVFDLLTALINSWTLWNDVAGSPADGLHWRRQYLALTYGEGAYRPYEEIVRQAAERSGLSARCADELARRWDELPPWPETVAVFRIRRFFAESARLDRLRAEIRQRSFRPIGAAKPSPTSRTAWRKF